MLARTGAVLLLAIGLATGQAAPPPLLQLQGRLTDSAGQPITSATRDLRVEFYDSAVGGLLLGSSTVVDPTMANGIYSVSITPPAGVFANNASVFMEMAVGSGVAGADPAFEVLSPRTRVLAVAYALNADTLDGRDSSSFGTSANAFFQGGNAFGALATLGTNDGFGLAFETAGAERLRLDTSGRLGIGTSNPTARLEVVGGGTTTSHVRIGPNTNNNLQVYIDGVYAGDAGSPQALAVRTNLRPSGWAAGVDVEPTIDAAGGMVSEASGIYVGVIPTTGTITNASALLINGAPTGTATNKYALRVASGDSVFGGNVGVGTTAPSTYLHVSGPSSVNGTLARFDRTDAGEADLELQSAGAGTFFINTNAPVLELAANQAFGVADDPGQFALTAAGSVGIGTASPTANLEVQAPAGNNPAVAALDSTGGNQAYLQFQDAGTTRISMGYRPSTGNFVISSGPDPSGNERLVVERATGRVGIGTASPAVPLHLVQNAVNAGSQGQYNAILADARPFAAGVGGGVGFAGRFNAAGNFADFGVVSGRKEDGVDGSQSGYLGFYTHSGADILERMRISSAGNVGIGTGTPGARLTVVAGVTTDTLGANGASDGFDIAEAISAAADVEVGDVVSADPATSQRVVRASTPYDPTLLGVITSQPAIAIGATDGNRHIALAGRVAVRVSLENGPIHRGDYLTSSWRPGVAMRATRPGRVVGTALGEFAGEGEGKVVVFVSPGWWDGGSTAELADRVTDLSGRLDRAERENDELRKRLDRLEALVEARLR